MNRRQFLKGACTMGISSAFFPVRNFLHASPKNKKKVLVLGVDGMDVHLTQIYLQTGLMPNLRKVIQKGSMRAVMTSMPPQSPVAWSNFIVGASPSVHGIYDFIHREPATMTPYLSTSRVVPPSRILDVGDYKIPLSKGNTEMLRKGKPFWEYLAQVDIPTTLFKIPANFPCNSSKVDMISGMGTPDLRGGYGSYTVFTTSTDSFKKEVTGGRVVAVSFKDNRMDTKIAGPVNSLKKGNPEAMVPLTVWRDYSNAVARLVIQDNEIILREGEWSDWLRIKFPMLGSLYEVSGICKVYLKSLSSNFFMYVSPINIDPTDPALPIVSSEDYARELTEQAGLFYTQGFPEDTKALSEGVLNEEEYLELARQIIEERSNLLQLELARFQRVDHGLLFFYFSSLDQNTHMYWRTIDKGHPMYSDELNKKYGNTLKTYYSKIDSVFGEVLGKFDINDPNFTLIIMSDHGFGPFRRQINLNSWLFENGYMALKNTRDIEGKEYFENVNWARTGAYNLGINSIYLNMKGREERGVVPKNQSRGLLNDLSKQLLNLVDPQTDLKAVSSVRIVPDEEKNMHPHAPDLIVGWNTGYRTSWKSILGGFENSVISDNLDKWSGDHCVDPALVPALLVSNKAVDKKNLKLSDLTATILDEFNIVQDSQFEGASIFRL